MKRQLSRPVLSALESERQAGCQQSLTRLFSAASALTADDPLDLFRATLMQFDTRRGPCRNHKTFALFGSPELTMNAESRPPEFDCLPAASLDLLR